MIMRLQREFSKHDIKFLKPELLVSAGVTWSEYQKIYVQQLQITSFKENF